MSRVNFSKYTQNGPSILASASLVFNKINILYNKCIPKKKITTKTQRKFERPWLTKGILKSLKTKNKLYKNTLEKPTENSKSKYKQYRNKLNHVIRIAKKRYYNNNRFGQAKENLKQTWKLINEIINKKNF